MLRKCVRGASSFSIKFNFLQVGKQGDRMSKTKTQAVIVKVKFCCMIQDSVGQLFPETLLQKIPLER